MKRRVILNKGKWSEGDCKRGSGWSKRSVGLERVRWEQDAETLARLSNVSVDEVDRLRERDSDGVAEVTHELYRRYWSGDRSPEAEVKLYSDPLYLIESWVCYFEWAKIAGDRFKKIAAQGELFSIPPGSTAVDLGAGCGLSTIDLLSVPGIERVIYQNHPKATTQIDYFQSVIPDELADSIELSLDGDIPKGDVYFASEFYEHIRRPGDHLESVLAHEPFAFVHATSFSAPWAPGHFHEYHYGDKSVPGNRGAKRLFHNILRARGYERRHCTTFWNGRPAVWIKPSS